jgi:hypothetical protein
MRTLGTQAALCVLDGEERDALRGSVLTLEEPA